MTADEDLATVRPPVVRHQPTPEEIAEFEAEWCEDNEADAAPAEVLELAMPLCDICGWTIGMVCPECPGCGCYTGRCTGWRHSEYAHDDDFEDDVDDGWGGRQ